MSILNTALQRRIKKYKSIVRKKKLPNEDWGFIDHFLLDYLQHAECIKEKSTTEVYCGSHYSRYEIMKV